MRRWRRLGTSGALAWAAFAAIAPAAAADGPSFDCAKATTRVERAICATPALAALDREIAGHIVGRLRGASPERAEAVRREQRAWLRSRNECERHAAGGNEIGLCLQVAMTARAVALRPPAPASPPQAPAAAPVPPREARPPIAAGPWSVVEADGSCAIERAAAAGRRLLVERRRDAPAADPGAIAFLPGPRDAGLIEPGDRVVLIVDQERLPAAVSGEPLRIVVAPAHAASAMRALARGRELIVVRQIDTLLRVPLDGFPAAFRDLAGRCGFDPGPFL